MKKMLAKKFLLCLIIGMVCCSLTTKAQKYYGQWVVGGHGSFYRGFGGGIEVEKYLGKSLSFLRLRLSYSHFENKSQKWKLPTNSIIGDFAYFYSLEKYMPKSFIVNLGGGFLLGQEKYKNKNLPSGVIQASTNKIITGIVFHPQAEFNLGKISTYIEPSVGYLFNTAFSHFHVKISVGIKYYFSI
ncbi:MAG: conjugal transfer protein TraO [Butyricimonas faecihominis]